REPLAARVPPPARLASPPTGLWLPAAATGNARRAPAPPTPRVHRGCSGAGDLTPPGCAAAHAPPFPAPQAPPRPHEHRCRYRGPSCVQASLNPPMHVGLNLIYLV